MLADRLKNVPPDKDLSCAQNRTERTCFTTGRPSCIYTYILSFSLSLAIRLVPDLVLGTSITAAGPGRLGRRLLRVARSKGRWRRNQRAELFNTQVNPKPPAISFFCSFIKKIDNSFIFVHVSSLKRTSQRI